MTIAVHYRVFVISLVIKYDSRKRKRASDSGEEPQAKKSKKLV